jgi:hypothetical protein
VDLFSWIKITARAEVFVSYAMFSSRACHDLLGCRGIWKKCCPALAAWDWQRPWELAGIGAEFSEKRAFALFPQI